MEIVNILESTEYDIHKMRSEDALLLIRNIFEKNKFNTDILNFDPLLSKEARTAKLYLNFGTYYILSKETIREPAMNLLLSIYKKYAICQSNLPE